jgi:glycosyltransferase involved in cell wall biosynthesis
LPVERIGAQDSIAAARGDAVVVIPVFGAVELLAECLQSVLAHTDPRVPLVVADDATPADSVGALLESLDPRAPVFHLRRDRNVGFVVNVNDALAVTSPADVVVLNSDCVVGPGWIDGLTDAALSDTRVATASALADNGSILSVRSDLPLRAAAEAIRDRSHRVRPRIPTAIGHCFYLRRSALELVGDLDTAFSPGYGEEVDFAQRCVLNGLIHVAADDVYVHHRGEGSFGAGAAQTRASHERLIEQRYPYYPAAVRAAEGSRPLNDALAAARRATGGLSVTIEASALGPVAMGTQVTTRALIRSLAAVPGLRLRVVVPRGVDVAGVELLHPDELERGVERTDVVHRPSQPTEPKQLDWLHRLGERIVITHQDLIGYANPAYFDSYESWDEHRTLTRQALALADAAVFVSDYVRRDALAEELVDPGQAHVVAQGVDVAAVAPEAPVPAPAPGFLLCLGADFRHKNRLFALRLFEELQSRGFEGQLVLAGPRMPYGSSRSDERASGVVTLEQVSEAEKAWLYANARLALYPTVSEGFGLVPFEAAAAGTPCMFAPISSLPEVVGAENATIVPWDVEATADNAMPLLEDGHELTQRIAARGERYTWERTAEALLDVYRGVVRRPARAARAIYFGEAISDVALSLVGPGGYLPPEVQRALLAVSTRPTLRRPIFGALRASYRLLRRRRI